MNADIEKHFKAVCYMPGKSAETWPQEKTILYEVPCKLWKVVGANIYFVKNKRLLCIVHYYSMFPIVRKVLQQMTL